MTDISATSIPARKTGDAEFGDYFRLLKPRVMSL
ncbi:MAG: protoheme IX farnesyltransferase, partial [Pseudomonadota bacterium]